MQRSTNSPRVPTRKPFSSLLLSLTPLAFSFLYSPLTIAQPGPSQDPLTIDFETFPGADGELGTADDIPTPSCDLDCLPLGFEYSSVGVTFDSGWLYQLDFFPDAPATNHFVSLLPLEVTLDPPVFAASIESYSLWSATLWALDAEDNVITTSELVHPDVGNTFVLGTVAIESAVPIHRLVLRESSCNLVDFCEPILNVDDLTLFYSPPSLFADGFESGDTSAWTTVVP